MAGVAVEQAQYGVRANCVCPGTIDTAWTHKETGAVGAMARREASTPPTPTLDLHHPHDGTLYKAGRCPTRRRRVDSWIGPSPGCRSPDRKTRCSQPLRFRRGFQRKISNVLESSIPRS
jgi:hypothetical protein